MTQPPTDQSAPAADPASLGDSPVIDLAILGAGSGGYAAALRAAQLGLQVVLVEQAEVGGTCLHRGCIPTKAILHAAEVADATRDAARVGVQATYAGVDPAAVRTFATGIVDTLYSGLTSLIAQRGITVVAGHGTLVRDDQGIGLAVNDQIIRARAVVLATGSRPRTLGLPIDGHRVITSDDALALRSLPGSAVVLGGGVIGVEFASAWRSFGVDVTVVEALDRLVPGEDPAASRQLARAFRERGITVLTSTTVRGVELTGSAVRVDLEPDRSLNADQVLVAVGREPVSDTAGFAEAGVRLDQGYVVTDEFLGTSVTGVYAVGDLVPGPQLAHRGFGHGIFVAERVAHLAGRLARRPVLVPDHLVPRVTYSDPQIASVGWSAEQASARGPVEVTEYRLNGNARAQILGTSGFVRIVAAKDGPILGVTMVGAGVSDLVGEAQLMTGWEALPSEVAAFIHAHPTLDEALGEAAMALAGQPLHVHG